MSKKLQSHYEENVYFLLTSCQSQFCILQNIKKHWNTFFLLYTITINHLRYTYVGSPIEFWKKIYKLNLKITLNGMVVFLSWRNFFVEVLNT